MRKRKGIWIKEERKGDELHRVFGWSTGRGRGLVAQGKKVDKPTEFDQGLHVIVKGFVGHT